MNKVEKKPIKSNFKSRVFGFLGDSEEEAFQEEVMNEVGKIKQEIDKLEWVINNEVLSKDQKKIDRITASPV